MGIITEIMSSPREQRSHTRLHRDYERFLLGNTTASGVVVDADTAMNISAIYACVRLCVNVIATNPWEVKRNLPNGGEEVLKQHPLHNRLHNDPNKWQTSVEFWDMMIGHLSLRSVAYAEIVQGKIQPVGQIIPLHPDRVTPKMTDDGRLVYEFVSVKGEKITFQEHQIFRIYDFGFNPFAATPKIENMKDDVAIAMQSTNYTSSFFKNMFKPAGFFKYPEEMGKKAKENIRKSMEESNSGTGKVGKFGILEGGLEWETMGLTHEQAQFEQLKKLSVRDICRWFNMPLKMVQEFDDAKYDNLGQDINFHKYTARPLAVRVEKAVQKCLFRPEILAQKDIDDTRAKCNLDGFLRGDIETRTESFSKQWEHGAINIDEWREMEGKNPLPDGLGKKHYVPLNFGEVGKAAYVEPKKVDRNQFRKLTASILRRLWTKESNAVRREIERDSYSATWRNDFLEKHSSQVAEALQEAAALYRGEDCEDIVKSFALGMVSRTWSEVEENLDAAWAEDRFQQEISLLIAALEENTEEKENV